MTESTQNPAPSRTDAASCEDCSKLLAFAELDELIAAGVASPGQMTQHDELARELSGDKQSGEAVAAVLARQLAEERHRTDMMASVRVKADELLRRFSREYGPESLRKDPTLAILPSGNAISLSCIREARIAGTNQSMLILHDEASDHIRIDDPTDVAALRAALLNIGVAINAPTIAGEDRDGDGRTGE